MPLSNLQKIQVAEHRLKVALNNVRRQQEVLRRLRQEVSRQPAGEVSKATTPQSQVRTKSSSSQTRTMVQEDHDTQAHEVEALAYGFREQLWFGTEEED